MTDHLKTLESLIPKFNKDDVILIEGRIPPTLDKLLQKNSNKTRKND